MSVELPVETILPNPYNSRSSYTSSGIDNLADSMNSNGLLSPIRVRPSPVAPGKYELVFGHRRLLAARKIGWTKIRAEIIFLDDKEMLMQSLVENLERVDISDYEKALVFERLNTEFHLTYEEIGKLADCSKQHVSNHIAMLRLFDKEELTRNPNLVEVLHKISEAHARVLSRVSDKNTRINLAFMVEREKLTVKELLNMIAHFRSWCNGSEIDEVRAPNSNSAAREIRGYPEEVSSIKRLILQDFELPHTGNFQRFRKMHSFNDGFSMYSAFPPFSRLEGDLAYYREWEWFFSEGRKVNSRIESCNVDILGDTALATVIVHYTGKKSNEPIDLRSRGSIVFVKRHSKWKIYHEHWSIMTPDNPDVALFSKTELRSRVPS